MHAQFLDEYPDLRYRGIEECIAVTIEYYHTIFEEHKPVRDL